MLKAGSKRIFLRSDAVAAVGAEDWNWLLRISEQNIPLIKSLDINNFEFQHRSFQEALFAEALSEGEVSEDQFMSVKKVKQNWELIKSGALANTWRIGGQSVADVLKRGLGQPQEDIPVKWNAHVWSALFNCRVATHTLAFLHDLSVQYKSITGLYRELRREKYLCVSGLLLV